MTRKLRGVFFGTSPFAVPALRSFAEHVAPALVITQPDRAAGRGQKLQATPVKRAAHELGIPTLEPAKLRDVLPELTAANADVYAVASYGKIVPQAVLDLPRLGALNVHPSLLPLYRGATPLQSQLRDGVTASGVTIILMDAGMDTGDILLQQRSPIAPRETYGELHDRFAALGAALLGRACGALAAGTLARIPQRGLAPEEEVARTLTRPLAKDDLIVDWTWPAKRIVDIVRSLAPQPLARATIGEAVVKLVTVDALAATGEAAFETARGTALPGAILRSQVAKGALVVRCGDGAILVKRLVAPSRGEMDGASYAQRIANDVPPVLPL